MVLRPCSPTLRLVATAGLLPAKARFVPLFACIVACFPESLVVCVTYLVEYLCVYLRERKCIIAQKVRIYYWSPCVNRYLHGDSALGQGKGGG